MLLEDHYKQLLGLGEDWRVERVTLNTRGMQVDIWLEHCGGEAKCPCCRSAGAYYGREPERKWRHLDTMGFQTVLHAAAARVQCKLCGVTAEGVPWAGRKSRFTLLFEGFVVRVLEACRSKAETARLLKLEWKQIDAIMKRAVERGLARRLEVPVSWLGIDEKSFLKGQSYVTVLVDIESGRVLEVAEGRRREDAECLIDKALTPWQRDMVCATAMDMSDAFEAAVRATLPNSDIVHDKFHIAAHLCDAVDAERRREHAALRKAGDHTLTGTRYDWLRSGAAAGEGERAEFEALSKLWLDVAKAWRVKELFSAFWTRRDKQSARNFFAHWFKEAMATGLQAVKKVAAMLKGRLENILTYFDSYITNAAAEGFNSRIQAIKANSRGFRSFENYRVSILFFCGGLDLYPKIP